MDESVIFEIQVEKKILEQVFKENRHLKDSYEKLTAAEDTIRPLKEEIANLKEEAKQREQTTKELHEENIKLKAIIKEFERSQRINEQKYKAINLEQTESKLLKMKLQKAEKEKQSMIDKFEEERKILEELVQDQSKLQVTETQLEQTKKNLTKVTDELKKTKRMLIKSETESHQLDKDKLNLEIQLGKLTKKLRLQEEKEKSHDLEHVESKLLKLKLHSVEKEKKYLLEEFERERTIISQQNKPRVAKIEENLKHLRNWIEKEARNRQPLDSEEVKFLKEKIHMLENDKIDLIEGFELERKVFQKILKANGDYSLP